ncbi:hypothetical protein AGLY_010156 [Aphis glycines]|uniref:Uncharacterized protein n=1 Tax=Aphis glycines TaxID=307491 RepID=A0A6G0THE4_APHGL|nr:hypothetical protein AGLY_010156 [Aphis glycines]
MNSPYGLKFISFVNYWLHEKYSCCFIEKEPLIILHTPASPFRQQIGHVSISVDSFPISLSKTVIPFFLMDHLRQFLGHLPETFTSTFIHSFLIIFFKTLNNNDSYDCRHISALHNKHLKKHKRKIVYTNILDLPFLILNVDDILMPFEPSHSWVFLLIKPNAKNIINIANRLQSKSYQKYIEHNAL